MASAGYQGLRTLTLRYCARHPASAGVRSFLQRNSGVNKPDGVLAGLPVETRVVGGTPCAIAEYNNGIRQRISLRNAAPTSVEKVVLKLAQRRGRKQVGFRRWHYPRNHKTESVQGFWKLNLL